MEKTKLKYIKYTKEELDKYVKDKGSCVNLLKNDMHISFPPWGFANFQETVTNIISRSKIGKYDRKLNGIVLDVRNIKVFGTNYAVHDDDPYNHIDLIANFYVFQPRIGAVITGVVKHKSYRHVSAIIYRVFNVSIRFKKQTNNALEINSKITFRIKKFDLQDGLPYIEGELIEDTTVAPVVSVKRKIIFDDEDDEGVGNALDSGISTEESEAICKKKRVTAVASTSRGNDIVSSSSEDDSDDDSDEQVDNNLVVANIKIKKEKLTDEEETSDSSDESDDESDGDAKKDSKKKLQKALSKQDTNGNEESSSSDDEETDSSVVIAKIKKEKNATSSSDSSSAESDSSDNETVPTVIKKEKNASSQELSQTSIAPLAVKIKQEPQSTESSTDDDIPPPKSKSKSKQNGSKKPAKNSKLETSVNDSTRNLSTKSKRSKSLVKQNGVVKNQTIADDSQFSSPMLSSTLKPSGKTNKKSVKNIKPTPSQKKKLKRPASDTSAKDTSSKKAKKSSKQKEKSLKNMEDDLFNSFLS